MLCTLRIKRSDQRHMYVNGTCHSWCPSGYQLAINQAVLVPGGFRRYISILFQIRPTQKMEPKFLIYPWPNPYYTFLLGRPSGFLSGQTSRPCPQTPKKGKTDTPMKSSAFLGMHRHRGCPTSPTSKPTSSSSYLRRRSCRLRPLEPASEGGIEVVEPDPGAREHRVRLQVVRAVNRGRRRSGDDAK